MRRRLALSVSSALILALSLAVGSASAGGGSLSIGNGGADGEVSGGFQAFDGTSWTAVPFCQTGFFEVIPGILGLEARFALEFPLSGLPAGASITSASLSLRTSRHDLVLQTANYGYAGDGAIAPADVQVSGTPVLFTPSISTGREAHDVTSLLTAAVVSSGWAGFSLRQDPLGTTDGFWDCPTNSLYPILTILYDLPNSPTPVASDLPDAAINELSPVSDIAVLGVGLLLIASLSALAVVGAKSRTP